MDIKEKDNYYEKSKTMYSIAFSKEIQDREVARVYKVQNIFNNYLTLRIFPEIPTLLAHQQTLKSICIST